MLITKKEKELNIPQEEFDNLFTKIMVKCQEKMTSGYKKYGTEMKTNPNDEVEEELADMINYQIMGIIKIRKKLLKLTTPCECCASQTTGDSKKLTF